MSFINNRFSWRHTKFLTHFLIRGLQVVVGKMALELQGHSENPQRIRDSLQAGQEFVVVEYQRRHLHLVALVVGGYLVQPFPYFLAVGFLGWQAGQVLDLW
jgi:hypothetical protein